MSINKFITFFSKNRAFFRLIVIERQGFWIFELLVSVVILMVITLSLFRFSCNMVAIECDSINRLMAIDCIASHLDSQSEPWRSRGGGSARLPVNAEFDSKVSNINIVKSNLPESVKNWQKGRYFKVLSVSATCKSAFGKDIVVKMFASAANGGDNG